MKSVVLAVAAGAVTYQMIDSRSSLHRHVVPRGLRVLDPETAHRVAVLAMAIGLHPRDTSEDDPILATTVWGKSFSNPVGMAAGFDKHGEVVDALFQCGFGFVEVGSVTPRPQDGNPRPRVFRLLLDDAVINRYGFNSHGLAAVQARLNNRKNHLSLAHMLSDLHNFSSCRTGILGINLGKNKDTSDDGVDFVKGVEGLGPLADYIVVNVSSPNTPGLRDIQAADRLEALMKTVVASRNGLNASSPAQRPPVLVKISPDIASEALPDLARAIMRAGVDGVIVSNTTLSRPKTLVDDSRYETGGLSGRPLMTLSTAVLRDMYALTKGQVPLIGAGGVASAEDAYIKIRNGASLVQLYSSLVYQGPALVPDIKTGLADLLRADGFSSVADAVGVDVPLSSVRATAVLNEGAAV